MMKRVMSKALVIPLLAAIIVPSCGFVICNSPYQQQHGRRCGFTVKRSVFPTASTSLSMAFSTSSRSTDNNRNRRKKSLADRSRQEAVDLIRDILKAAVEAGPRAGPARTLEAYRAVAQTAQEFLPKLLTSNSRSVSSMFPVIIRTLFERMGITYIKLGQFVASSPTLFPKEYVKEFQKCLDQTEPLPWSTIERVIEEELGGPSSLFFSYIDEKPLASASIAQVHAAQLKSGEDVVIKVQKPGIDASLKADLGFLYVAARVLEFIQPDWERTSLSAVAGDIRSSMLEELDFELEARNTIEFRRFLQEYGLLNQATAPLVYADYTTKRILTMERLHGVSMLDEETISKVIKDPELGTATIITALNIWSLSVTAMPWFHADVHAGNLLLCKDGRVGFIDFGIVGRISDKVFQAVNELSVALAVGDSQAMAQALCNMGAADENVDTVKFGKDIERVMQKMNTVQTDVTVAVSREGQVRGLVEVDENEITNLLLEIVEVTENNGLKLPREFGLLVKQSLYFDRYLKILAPSVDVMNDSRVMIGGKPRAESSSDSSKAPVNGEQVVIDVV